MRLIANGAVTGTQSFYEFPARYQKQVMSSWTLLVEFFVFALICVFPLSRLLLFMSKRWNEGYVRVVAANAVSAVICIFVFGLLKGWHPLWVLAIPVLGAAQLLVLLTDIGRKFRSGRAAEK
jgi:hypothetical protein